MASRYGTLSVVSAAWRTIGLALKAMPRPATANMSMSLAPSPTAMVRDQRHAGGRGEPQEGLRLPRPVHDRPDQPAGEHPVLDRQLVGRQMVDAQLGDQTAPITWVNPPLTTAVS